MDGFTAFLVGVALITTLGFTIRFGWRFQDRERHLTRLWSAAAKRLGGTLHLDRGVYFHGAKTCITADLDGRHVTINVARGGSGLRKTTTPGGTRVSTAIPETGGLRLCVCPETLWAFVGKALGGQDVLVGDQGFDAAYVIRTNNQDLARAWLPKDLRRAIVACQPYRFDLADGEVAATRVGIEEDPQRLVETARAVVSFACGGQELLRQTRALAAQIDGVVSARGDAWEPDGGVLTIVDRLGTQVLVDSICESVDGVWDVRVFTRIRARSLTSDLSRFAIASRAHKGKLPAELASLRELPGFGDEGFSERYTLMTGDSERLAEQLSSTLQQRIRTLKPVLVTGQGREVTVLLPGLMFDSRPVNDAIELATSLTSAVAAAPYR